MYYNILAKICTAIPARHVTPYDIHLQARKLWRALRYLSCGRSFPVFNELALELTSFCNRRCAACPVSIAPRPMDGVMDDGILTKILCELRSMKFGGRIATHFFNEPLADRDIVSKIRRIASQVPRASIEMNSNGDYLTPKLLENLIDAGLCFMLVTTNTDEGFRRLQHLYQGLRSRDRNRIVINRAPQYVGNRAGTLQHLLVPESLKADCFQPSYKLVINYKGEAVICSNDYFGKSVVGNVAEQTLLDIWRSPAFEEIRHILCSHERHKLPSCKGCNLLSTPFVFRYLTSQETVAYNRQSSRNF